MEGFIRQCLVIISISDLVRSLENAEKVFHRVYQLAISTGGIYVLDVALSREVGALAKILQAVSTVAGTVPLLVHAYTNPGEATGRALLIYPANKGRLEDVVNAAKNAGAIIMSASYIKAEKL